MASEPRLRTAIWVEACIRRANLDSIGLILVHRGDPTAGTVLVKLNQHPQGCTVLLETRDPDGNRAWLKGTGPTLINEQAADAYIARHRQRDPDLWVIEIEDRAGRLPFEARIIDPDAATLR